MTTKKPIPDFITETVEAIAALPDPESVVCMAIWVRVHPDATRTRKFIDWCIAHQAIATDSPQWSFIDDIHRALNANREVGTWRQKARKDCGLSSEEGEI